MRTLSSSPLNGSCELRRPMLKVTLLRMVFLSLSSSVFSGSGLPSTYKVTPAALPEPS